MKQRKYYDRNGFSPLEAFACGLISNEEYIGFCKGNIIKYTCRAGFKGNPISDLDKAIDYCEILKEIYKGEFKYGY